VDSAHGSWTTSGLGARWTGHGRRHRAHRSSVSSRSGVQGCRPRGGRGRGECGGPISGLTEGQAAARRQATMVEAAAGELQCGDAWGSELGQGGVGGEAVGGGDVGALFYRVGGGAGQLGDGGERAAAVVRHDGDGGGHFGRGSTGVVVWSDEGGGAPTILGVVGEALGGGTRVRLREEDDRAGPACR
jgi:hypothetical protein